MAIWKQPDRAYSFVSTSAGSILVEHARLMPFEILFIHFKKFKIWENSMKAL
jgi:hypothetical protein